MRLDDTTIEVFIRLQTARMALRGAAAEAGADDLLSDPLANAMVAVESAMEVCCQRLPALRLSRNA